MSHAHDLGKQTYRGHTSTAGDGYYPLKAVASTAPDTRAASALVQKKASVKPPAASVEGAVYSHIQAMRALGNTTVTTDQIARALSLPRSAVDMAVARMKDRGVKVAR